MQATPVDATLEVLQQIDDPIHDSAVGDLLLVLW